MKITRRRSSPAGPMAGLGRAPVAPRADGDAEEVEEEPEVLSAADVFSVADEATAHARDAAVGFEDADLPEEQMLEIEPVGDGPVPSGARPRAAGRPRRAASDDSALVPHDPLQYYLAEIRRHPVLSPEEEHALAVRWREAGDRDAARQLVTSNLRLVVAIARRYQRALRNMLDLIQEGNVGLLEAVKQYDPYRGVRFPSYAVWWIRAYIIRYVMNNWRLVKLGTTQAQRKLFFNLQKEKARLEREGFSPDPKLIADRLAVKEAEVVEMDQRLGSRDLSVDAPLGPENAGTWLDRLPGRESTPADRVGEAQLRDMVVREMRAFGEGLGGKDKAIFEERMIADEPLTLAELGERFGVSRERVRQLEDRLRQQLRRRLVERIPDIAEIDVGLGRAGES